MKYTYKNDNGVDLYISDFNKISSAYVKFNVYRVGTNAKGDVFHKKVVIGQLRWDGRAHIEMPNLIYFNKALSDWTTFNAVMESVLLEGKTLLGDGDFSEIKESDFENITISYYTGEIMEEKL